MGKQFNSTLKRIAAGVALLGFVTAANAEATTYEAEEQTGVDAASVVTADGYSNGKYLSVSKAMTFTVTVDETAMYDITANVIIHQYVWATSKILVNGAEVGSMLTTPRTCDSAYVITASAKMKAGENTITVGNDAMGVDYITVERHPDPTFNISAVPVTPGATEGAQKIKTFLRDNFMKKTVSGMMISDQNFNYNYGEDRLWNLGECTPEDSCSYADSLVVWKGQTDISEFYKRSGHYPAIGGFDMLFAVGGHHEEGWFKGYTLNNLIMAEDLWNMGGIPTFTWHWKVGQDTVFYTQGSPAGFNNPGCSADSVLGTSSTNTCFNYTKAFKTETTCTEMDTAADTCKTTQLNCLEIDETSQTYKDIVADLDIVSGYFKQLEEKGVSVIWRPLHEASGGWFWWGVAGSECYRELYKLVFNRMVNTNGNKNLLWVWNINTDPAKGYDYSALNGDWYPGDEYVDIVGVDIYDALLSHNSAANYFNKIVSEVGTNKLIALSENGAIPDIDSIAEDKSYWSYWMTWSQTWSGNFLDKTPTDMWQRNLDDERIIALDKMPGWANVVADTSSEGAVVAPIATKSTPMVFANNITVSLEGNTLSLYIPNAGRGSIALFDMTGHRVATLAQGNLLKGSLRFDMQAFASGNYVVRATAQSNSISKVIRVK